MLQSALGCYGQHVSCQDNIPLGLSSFERQPWQVGTAQRQAVELSLYLLLLSSGLLQLLYVSSLASEACAAPSSWPE